MKDISYRWKGVSMNKTHITFGKALTTVPKTVYSKRTDKFNKMLIIYFGGYATHKPYTVDEWFEAREYVMERQHLIPVR